MPVQPQHALLLALCLGLGVADLAVLNGVLVPKLLAPAMPEPDVVAVSTPTPSVAPGVTREAPPPERPPPAPTPTPRAEVPAEPQRPAASVGAPTTSPAPTAAAPVEPQRPAASVGAPATPEPLVFGTRSADLSEVAQTQLHRVAAAMRKDKSLKILLRGHTDERGSPEGNTTLAQARASAAASFLTRQGVARDRISIEAVGSAEPLDNSGSPEGWAKNRRVQFVWK